LVAGFAFQMPPCRRLFPQIVPAHHFVGPPEQFKKRAACYFIPVSGENKIRPGDIPN
jgi:hypothetical protein